MAYLNIRELKHRGSVVAASTGGTRKLVLLYCGAIAALSLGSNGLHLFLDSQIGNTGGLGGMGLRSVLQTIQGILTWVNMVFGPFWSAGFLFAMVGMVRGREPRLGDMTEGFRRFGRMLGLISFQLMVILLLVMGSVNLAGVIFSFSPMGTKFAEQMGPALTDPNLITADGTINMDLVPVEAVATAAIPMILIFLLLFVPMYIWLQYGFRMAMYLVVDRSMGGTRAHFESLRLMRGHKWQLLKLDLSFWWYHVLGLLIAGVGYLDVLLAMLGINLPFDPMVMYFGTLVAYCVLLTLLSLWKKCEVDAAYVLAFEAIVHPEPAQALSETE